MIHRPFVLAALAGALETLPQLALPCALEEAHGHVGHRDLGESRSKPRELCREKIGYYIYIYMIHMIYNGDQWGHVTNTMKFDSLTFKKMF